ncbi:hypothetical protein BDN70DRAFT_966570 [Pholiota conissans]|uniref:Uncharacterized protein n=1 Tax=Pholiota conissans TaxID=109636 RepID=A0A9P6CTM0_9AGAR|nr:hypothetical protein BDN70DRAFT_966570 [Pholiota conissans]
MYALQDIRQLLNYKEMSRKLTTPLDVVTMSDSMLHQAILQAGFTVNDEKLLIATSLHVIIFQALLMGIYTVIFGGTMYAYLIQQRSKHYAVSVTISILYITNIAVFSIQWYSTKLQFINNGTSRDTIFAALYTNSGTDIIALHTALNFLTAVSLVLSDGLLIWRCFNLWNRSIYAISIPVFLTFVEAAQTIGSEIVPQTAISSQLRLNRVVGNIFNTQSPAPSTQLLSFNFWTAAFGMSTTIMVARVATLSDESNAPTSGHSTGIQFRPRSTARTRTDAQVSVVLRGPEDTSGSLASEDNQAQVTASNLMKKDKQEV